MPSTANNGYLIDSGIVMRQLRGDRRAADLLRRLRRAGAISTSALVFFEVLRGCRTPAEEAAARNLFEFIPVVDVTNLVAEAAALIAREYRGVLSGDRATPDSLIAGSALSRGATLVTLNTRQFARLIVPGLDILLVNQQSDDWTTSIS
jgi:predicted nucleic acid-binding protein